MSDLPPHDTEAEKAVLGAALSFPDAVNRLVACDLEAGDFFREEHQWIFSALMDSLERHGYADAITVAAELRAAERWDRFGPLGDSAAYVSSLGENVYTAVGVEAHIAVVKDCARSRDIIQAAGKIAAAAYAERKPAAVIERGISSLSALLGGATGMVRLGDLPPSDTTGPEWGVPILDHMTMGMVPGGLTLLAAGSGVGKSMFAIHVAREAAAAGGRCAIFTMEMSSAEYQERMAHSVARVRKRYSKYDAPFTETEQRLLAEARQTLGGWDIHSYDRTVRVERIVAAVKLLAAEKRVDLVVVDYLHLMDMPGGETTPQALKDITKALKQLAVDTCCHVLLLSQMNRAAIGEMRGKDGQKLECLVTGLKYPQPFKEGLMGGAVENDADLVVQLQRHTGCDRNHIEICVTKNRHGVEGHAMMIENFAVCRFDLITQAEIATLAAGDMTIHTALMKDQGYQKGE